MAIVVKIGGAVTEDTDAIASFFTELLDFGERILVVHGGGARVSALSRQLGIEPRFVDGVRMTGDREMDVVEMILGGIVNGGLVRTANRVGHRAIGVRGSDTNIVRGRRLEGSRTAYVESVAPELITKLWSAGLLPILAPIGVDANNDAVNINADECARAIGGALAGKDETTLAYLSDVPGVLDDNQRPIPVVSTNEIEGLIAAGTISGGMAAKVRAAGVAITAGLSSIRIGTWRNPGDFGRLLIGDAGTTITKKKGDGG